ncbi:hypothetical protein D9M69_501010 [compost metagenome]
MPGALDFGNGCDWVEAHSKQLTALRNPLGRQVRFSGKVKGSLEITAQPVGSGPHAVAGLGLSLVADTTPLRLALEYTSQNLLNILRLNVGSLMMNKLGVRIFNVRSEELPHLPMAHLALPLQVGSIGFQQLDEAALTRLDLGLTLTLSTHDFVNGRTLGFAL